VDVDASYIRESILNPQAKLVAGYQALMPTFQGLVNEQGVMALIEYIRSLQQAAPGAAAAAAGAGSGAAPAADAAAPAAPQNR
jgi:cytochrome c oxidase subunit 2